MEGWVVLSNFLIVFYLVLKVIIGKIEYYPVFVFFLLLFASINVLYFVVDNKLVKSLLMGLFIVILWWNYVYGNRLFILFLPFGLFNIAYTILKKPLSGVIFVLFSFLFLDKVLLPEYFLISFLLYVIYQFSFITSVEIGKLKEENADLRKKIYLLSAERLKNNSYEDQLKYVAKLEERNEISQKIHDYIGHTISGSLMQLEAVKILVLNNEKEKAEKFIQRTIEVLRSGHEEIRKVLKEIKPESDKVEINRVKLLIEKFKRTSNLEVSFKWEGKIERINYVYWSIMYENLRECLTNILKHSKATKVEIFIEVYNKFVKLEVKDNGIGKESIKKGLGLIGIEERAAGVGGKVILDGSNGFSVISLLPLEGEGNGD
ncbi:Signal transduction histidine kinase [Thermoanaerobacter sp. YS13]|uniref:sensor histidine kinase n=1 Tax=Thermoanaerobacter sp. YS13 TaxID=1511746 RepID=UPI000574F559|nr:histidine kinase [Thermoanaerobacter sp. YS13]KHO61780.1 Signal transduction histidine kinase [Thermoanaerobacter sp. YS13]